MNLSISNRVVKDARRLPQPIQNQLATVLRAIQNAQNYADIPHLRALTGYKNYYRVRIGDYRLGLFWTGDGFIAEFIDKRGDFYKKIPPSVKQPLYLCAKAVLVNYLLFWIY